MRPIPPHPFVCSLVLLGWSAQLALSQTASLPTKPDYNFDVRPILSDRCFFCHGTDAANRKAGLRLDTYAGATEVLKSGFQAVVPGQPEKSELLKRIHTTDPDEIMPSTSSKLSLTEDEKKILTTWVAQGAEYKRHWAFTAPVATKAAEVSGKHGPAKTEVDKHVLHTLQSKGLDFAAPASRERLLRRMSLDLTGLPPTVEELAAFKSDSSEQAVEKAIDGLMAKPAFGERLAQDWMDVARFADTFGYQADVTMHTWPWRDWVIKAFNDNMPFDQFVTWQLAGDLLPKPTREQLVATAFNRLHRQTNEGGSVEEEFRVEYVSDRVQTFGLAFLGLTLECAKCHDHKYDPVTAKDFYSLSSFFANIDESGLYSHFTDAVPTPALALTSEERDKTIAAAKANLTLAEEKLVEVEKAELARFPLWKEMDGKIDVTAGLVAHFPFEKLEKNQSPNLADDKSPAKGADGPKLAPGKEGQALLLDGENNLSFPTGGKWTRDDTFTFSFWLKTPDEKSRAVILHRSKAWTDAASCGYELLIEEGALSAALVHFWPGNAIRVVSQEKLPVNEWCHLVWSYDGSSKAAGVKLYLNGRPLQTTAVRDGLTKDINRGGEDSVTLGQRFRDRGFKNGLLDELRIYNRVLAPGEAALLAGSAPPEPEAASLQQFYLTAKSAPYREATAALKQAREARSAAVDKVQELMVMKELPEPKQSYLLKRGSYEMRGEPVSADVPNAILEMNQDLPRNRLGLAQWILDPQHPLTARVVVNRFWHQLWGRGLVATPEDFGMQGSLPSHPALLDYLAVQFRENGWDVRKLLKLMMLTQAYQQESVASAEARAADPENTFLSRGPRVKLSAEAIRDQALAVAGQLETKLGGPSVDPDKTNRRSMYTFWKRTMPDVRMEIFDMAKREVCVARRQVTNTPLQALTLLNEPKFVAAATQAAEAAAKAENNDPNKTIRRLFLQILSREPSEKEAAVTLKLFEEQGSSFTTVASLLMNHDEFVMKR
jgi:hypothetical protein